MSPVAEWSFNMTVCRWLEICALQGLQRVDALSWAIALLGVLDAVRAGFLGRLVTKGRVKRLMVVRA